MSTIHKNILPVIAIALYSFFITSCMIWTTAYLTPEVSGTVINVSESTPMEGYVVKFPDFDQTAKTDSAGFFKLNAITETRYFTMILPGSSVRYTPVAAYRDEQVVAWGWAVNYSWTKPKAEIYIFDLSNHGHSRLESVTNPKLAYLIQLSEYLQKEENQDNLINFIAPEHDDLWHFTQAWPENVKFLGREDGLDNDQIDEIIAPFRELNRRFANR